MPVLFLLLDIRAVILHKGNLKLEYVVDCKCLLEKIIIYNQANFLTTGGALNILRTKISCNYLINANTWFYIKKNEFHINLVILCVN